MSFLKKNYLNIIRFVVLAVLIGVVLTPTKPSFQQEKQIAEGAMHVLMDSYTTCGTLCIEAVSNSMQGREHAPSSIIGACLTSCLEEMSTNGFEKFITTYNKN
jgi:hypothetical protein